MKTSAYKNVAMIIGARLKTWRKSRGGKSGKGWTLKTLSGIVSVSEGSLSDIENGNTFPSCMTLWKLHHYAGLDVTFLLCGDRRSV